MVRAGIPRLEDLSLECLTRNEIESKFSLHESWIRSGAQQFMSSYCFIAMTRVTGQVTLDLDPGPPMAFSSLSNIASTCSLTCGFC